MRDPRDLNGPSTLEGIETTPDVPEWRASDAYTVRRTGPVHGLPVHRRRAGGVDVLLGGLSLAILVGAFWGWLWAWGAVLRPLWLFLWGS